ncbi:hypothetical protein [Myroides sp. LJL110]
MQIKKYIVLVFAFVSFLQVQAQKTTVTANSYDISDNLDLQAVASIFGDSSDLADFEYRLNDPKSRISNLDLNNDGYVDYLRVVELVEGNTHLIVIQSVLGQDMYQDIATIEVEKQKKRGNVYIQVVGNSFLYGPNYIYEPVYVSRPPIFSLFWTNSYRPYYSSWNWGYYPSYYYNYNPYATNIYIGHIHNHINYNNNYLYHPYRYSNRARTLYKNNRNDYYERQYPDRDFRTKYKDANYVNHYDRYNSATSRSSYAVKSSSNNRTPVTDSDRNPYYSNGNSSSSSSRTSYTRDTNSNGSSASTNSRGNYSSNTSSNTSRSSYSSGNTGSYSSSPSYSRGTTSSSSGYTRSSSGNSTSSNINSSRSSSSRSSYSVPASSSNSRGSYSSPSSSRSSYSSPSNSSNSSKSSRTSSGSSRSNSGSSNSSRSSYSR